MVFTGWLDLALVLTRVLALHSALLLFADDDDMTTTTRLAHTRPVEREW